MKKKALSSIIALIFLLSALPAALAAAAYAYSLDALHFTDLSGNVLETPAGSCMASVRMTKTDAGRTATDSLILSAYSTTGELIAFNVMQSYLNPYEYRTFSSLINVPAGETLGEVRAFVWDNLADMTALSEMVSLTVNSPSVPTPELYTVSGFIKETPWTNTALDKSKAIFTIESADNFEGQKINPSNPVEIICDFGTSDIVYYPDLPVTAKLEKGEYNTYKLASYEKDVEVTTLKTTNIDRENCNLSAAPFSLSIFTSPATFNSTKRLSPNVRFYVNGAEITAPTASDLEEYLLNSSAPTFELVDFDNDRTYDVIYARYYAIGQVDTISAFTGKITFSSLNVRGSSITPDEKTCNIYKNGSEIALADIQAGDVLTVAYDVTMSLQSSSRYDIYVSSDTVKGQYKPSGLFSRKTVSIGGAEYEFAVGSYEDNVSAMTLLENYVLYLDAFGRIYIFEHVSSVRYAVLDGYTKSSVDGFYFYNATLYFADGTSSTNYSVFAVDGYSGGDLNKYLEAKVYNDTNGNGIIDDSERTDANKTPIQDRIISYNTLPSSQTIVLKFEDPRTGIGFFNENIHAIGAVKMSESTKIIDATTYNEKDQQTSYLDLATLSDFADGVDYEVYGYGERFSDGTYPLVVAVCGGSAYTENTRFAVISSNMPNPAYDPDTGSFIYTMDVIYNGETVLLETVDESELEIYDTDYYSVDAFELRKGDVIIFRGSPDSVEQINVIFRGSEYVGDYERNTITSLLQAGDNSDKIGIPADVEITSSGFSKWTTDWAPISTEQNVQLVVGPIVEKNTGYFTIGKIAESTYDDYYSDYYTGLYTDIYGDSSAEDGVLEINISDQTKVAVYNYFYPEQARPAVGATGDIIASTIPQSYCLGDDRNIIPWDTLVDENFPINFAFAKITNGEATDVFVINAP